MSAAPPDGPVVAFRTSQVSATDRGAAAAGLCLAIGSRPRAIVAQRLLWAAVSVSGPRLLPGPRTSRPPVEAGLWAEWSALLGRLDDLAYYRRPQASRDPGLTALLLRDGRAVALVKVRRDPAPLARERAALAALTGGLGPVRVPGLLGHRLDGARPWLAQEVVPQRPHRPAWLSAAALTRLTTAIAATLGGVLPRPAGTPAHWLPAHGDLTPWNLRRSGGRPVLFDWEDAGYAPPGTDLVYLAAACASAGLGPRALRRKPALPAETAQEAAEFCRRPSAEWRIDDVDAPFILGLRATLDDWYPTPGVCA